MALVNRLWLAHRSPPEFVAAIKVCTTSITRCLKLCGLIKDWQLECCWSWQDSTAFHFSGLLQLQNVTTRAEFVQPSESQGASSFKHFPSFFLSRIVKKDWSTALTAVIVCWQATSKLTPSFFGNTGYFLTGCLCLPRSTPSGGIINHFGYSPYCLRDNALTYMYMYTGPNQSYCNHSSKQILDDPDHPKIFYCWKFSELR